MKDGFRDSDGFRRKNPEDEIRNWSVSPKEWWKVDNQLKKFRGGSLGFLAAITSDLAAQGHLHLEECGSPFEIDIIPGGELVLFNPSLHEEARREKKMKKKPNKKQEVPISYEKGTNSTKLIFPEGIVVNILHK